MAFTIGLTSEVFYLSETAKLFKKPSHFSVQQMHYEWNVEIYTTKQRYT